MKLTGSCLCGAVSYEVSGEPLRMAQCHCTACRKITGTGHNVQAFFNASDVAINGKTSTHQSTSDSGNTRTRHFCPNCGSRLFSENSKAPGGIGIAVGSFDDVSWFKPEVVLYVSQRPAWDRDDAAIPTREEM
ncbi:MAG: GFA family protein [Devosiaceae bacterium]|nr:GFA family protein [Devosiaceae bacterium]